MRYPGVMLGIIGGAVCVGGGILSLCVGVDAFNNPQKAVLPPFLYISLGLYFIGKGLSAMGLALTTGNHT